MTVSITCKQRGALIEVDDEDTLVTEVHTHHVTDHGGAHSISRKQILARLQDQRSEER